MHTTAMNLGRLFFDTYAKDFETATVVDIGAQDVNGSLKEVIKSNCKYVGVDFVIGRGVDVILDDPYKLPFEDNSVDIIVSSSCFEHSEFFWLLFLEISRILKPGGVCYINAPSNGLFHQYPVDCWRFYPDSGRALAAWAKRNGIDMACLESFVSQQQGVKDGIWNDAVMVFLKDSTKRQMHPQRMINQKSDFTNGYIDDLPSPLNFQEKSQDMLKTESLLRNVNAFLTDIRRFQGTRHSDTESRFQDLAAVVNRFTSSL